MTSSHPWQEKKAKKPEAATAEKVEKPKDLCSHCRSIFWGCKSLIWDRIFNGCKSLIEQFFWGAVRGFSDLTSSHSWQEKRKDSEAAAAEKVEKPKDFCSHCRLIFLGL